MDAIRTLRYRLKVRDLFPPNDPLVSHLLRLMAAVNDLSALSRLYLQSSSRSGQNSSEEHIISSENVYFVRLSCGSLYEAALVFQEFRRELEQAGLLAEINYLDGQARESFHLLENTFRPGFEITSDFGKILVQLRNSIFHYQQPRVFRRALEEHDEEGELIIGEIGGVTRYTLADDLQVQIIMRPIGVEHKLAVLSDTVANLVIALQRFVNAWCDRHLQARHSAVQEQVPETVDIERLWRIQP